MYSTRHCGGTPVANFSVDFGGFFNRSDSTTPCTCEEMDDSYGLDDWVQPVMLCLYGGSFVIALGGNIAILFTILKRKQGSVTHIFIGSLCMSDVLVTLICVPTTVVSNLIYFYWPFWAFLCPLVMFLQVMTVLQRSLTLLAMTLDKHYVVSRPFSPRLKRKYVKIVMVGIWFVSAAAATPVYLATKIKYLEYEPGSLGLCIESWTDEVSASRYSYSLLVIQYVMPLVVMAISYTHIAYIIWVKKVPGECLQEREKKIASSKRKAVKMLMSVVCVYAVCWLPLHVLTILGQEDPTIFDNTIVHSTWLFAHWLAISNSGVNPLVYLCMNTGYRRGMNELFACFAVSNLKDKMRKVRFSSIRSSPEMRVSSSSDAVPRYHLIITLCSKGGSAADNELNVV